MQGLEKEARGEAAVADGGGKRPSRGRCERLLLVPDTDIDCDQSSEARQASWNLITKFLFAKEKVLLSQGVWGHLKVFKQDGS